MLISLKYLSLILVAVCLWSNTLSAASISQAWLDEQIQQSDLLDKKDPGLALDFASDVLANHSLSDQQRVPFLVRIARYYYNLGELDLAQQKIDEVSNISIDEHSSDNINIKITQASVWDLSGKGEQALALFKEAELLAKESNNLRLLADTYTYIAASYTTHYNDAEALRYFHMAYKLIEKEDNPLEMAYLKAQLATTYSYLFDYDKSMELSMEAITYFKENGYYFDELFAVSRLGQTYIDLGELEKAEQEFQRIYDISNNTDNEKLAGYIFVGQKGLAKVYTSMKDYEKARFFLNAYLRDRPHEDTFAEVLVNNLLLAKIEFAEGNYQLATEALAKAEQGLVELDKSTVLFRYIEFLDLKAKLVAQEKDFESAYLIQSKARNEYKKYQNLKRENIRSKFKVMFDTEQTILKNELLIKDQKLNNAALENSRYKQYIQNIILLCVSVFALGLSYIIYRQVKLSRMLKVIADTDVLTETANRRAVFKYAENKLKIASEHNAPLSIIVFDIDKFKNINDSFGHTTGDDILKYITNTAHDFVRENDMLGRIGGEEFLIVLPKTSKPQAGEIAERIRAAIASQKIELEEGVLEVTASFGVASFSENHKSFRLLFQEADVALYEAKNSGRNKVVLASPEV